MSFPRRLGVLVAGLFCAPAAFLGLTEMPSLRTIPPTTEVQPSVISAAPRAANLQILTLAGTAALCDTRWMFRDGTFASSTLLKRASRAPPGSQRSADLRSGAHNTNASSRKHVTTDYVSPRCHCGKNRNDLQHAPGFPGRVLLFYIISLQIFSPAVYRDS